MIFEPSRPPNAQSTKGEGAVYDFGPKALTSDPVLAVNAALAASRPLLVRGPPGCGKSTLAKAVARHFGVPYERFTVTSRTQAQDLLFVTDLVRRLADAHTAGVHSDLRHYLDPGPLFWAFAPELAARRGIDEGDAEVADPGRVPPGGPATPYGSPYAPTRVVLLDEIDKADPDVPNDLLEPLGEGSFQIPGRPDPIAIEREERRPLVLLTTNEERRLPAAFLRRCVELVLKPHDAAALLRIAKKTLPLTRSQTKWAKQLAERVETLRAQYDARPSTAEYLDVVRACVNLNAKPEVWEELMLVKPGQEA